MRLLTLILASLLCAPASRATTLDDQLFEKQMQILQHAWLSSHVGAKCDFLGPEGQALLEWGVAHVGGILAGAPQNRMGDKAGAFIGQRMRDKAEAIPCDAPARRGVIASLQTMGRLKAMHGDPEFARLSEDLRGFQMARALNRKCLFHDQAADEVLAGRIETAKRAIFARLGSEGASPGLDEDGRRIEAAVSANPAACGPALGDVVDQALRIARGTEDECRAKVGLETWLDQAQRAEDDRQAHLSALQACVAGRNDVQAEITALSGAILGTLDQAPEDLRGPLLRFTRAALRLAADAGHAPAQRELAQLHSPPPGSLLAELGGIDHPLALRWTRKAASRKEPRAMLDLAQHMRADDPATAYILLRAAQDSGITATPLESSLAAIREMLDEEAIRRLEANRAQFDFASLEAE